MFSIFNTGGFSRGMKKQIARNESSMTKQSNELLPKFRYFEPFTSKINVKDLLYFVFFKKTQF